MPGEAYKIIQLKDAPTFGLTPQQALRVNGLGSLYYFGKVILKRKKLTAKLHLPICLRFESDRLKDVIEISRDHLKSTMASEMLPMFWALPFTNQDEGLFRKLGYSDEFIRHLRIVHDPLTRTLLASENITNAAKLGSKIRFHYESNSLYRGLFPETLPTPKETWTNYSLCVNRNFAGSGSALVGGHGEGTFDFLGVGGALQSRHYNRAIQDDLVGRKAIESVSIMDKTIEYHRLLVGAFESDDKDHENSELVIGNRWSYNDLNSWIRENEPWWRIESHSALGGCCASHPADEPIWPEEFSFAKLMRLKDRLGSYNFSCQFQNNPAAPENADFRPEWLNYYSTKIDGHGRTVIIHESRNGVVLADAAVKPDEKDKLYSHLSICMATDPNHSGNAGAGRCRHAICVIGTDGNGNYYLLDTWAQAASYEVYIAKIFEIAKRWRLRKIGVETVAAQKYLAYHLRYEGRIIDYPISIVELRGEVDAPDGSVTRKKEWRIRNVLAPIFERGDFWVQRRFQDFITEYTTFPKGRFCDQLDVLAYTPQMLRSPMSSQQYQEARRRNLEQSQLVNRPYSYGAGRGSGLYVH